MEGILGVRAEPAAIHWAIVQGTLNRPILHAHGSEVAPNAYTEGESLVWIRKRLVYIIDTFKPMKVAVRYPHSSRTDHTLGEMVPLIYAVRNASAHGQKVPDSHFSPIAHPFGTVVGVDALAEAATFVIRKTVTEILRRGFRERFKDRNARENFWLYEYGLNGKQSKKRLREMHDSLERET